MCARCIRDAVPGLLKELSIDFLKRLPLVFIGPPFPDLNRKMHQRAPYALRQVSTAQDLGRSGFLHHSNCFTT